MLVCISGYAMTVSVKLGDVELYFWLDKDSLCKAPVHNIMLGCIYGYAMTV
jgi:hypothetical protein